MQIRAILKWCKPESSNYKDALKLYNEVYNLNKEDSKKENAINLPILIKIAFIHHSMGEVLLGSNDDLDTLEHCYIELAVQNKILEDKRTIYGDYHPEIKKTEPYAMKALQTIAYKLGPSSSKAQKIHQHISQFARSK